MDDLEALLKKKQMIEQKIADMKDATAMCFGEGLVAADMPAKTLVMILSRLDAKKLTSVAKRFARCVSATPYAGYLATDQELAKAVAHALAAKEPSAGKEPNPKKSST